MEFPISLFVFLFISTLYINVHATEIFSVTENGATPDGKTDCSQAFLSTWEKACKVDGGTVLVPSGTYLVKSALFEGPCNGQTVFNVIGTLKATPTSSIGVESWIEFSHVNGLVMIGKGVFDGQGASTWSRSVNCKAAGSFSCSNRPSSVKLKFVTNSSIKDVTSMNSKMFHFHLNNCDDVTMDRVSILAPEDSPNTDGIHVGASNNVQLSNLNIATGDDCISLGPGSTNINISDVTCGPGHGISIGSLGKYPNEKNVAGITIRNTTLSKTNNGLRIKTWAPSPPSTVSDVTFQDIILNDVDNPIIIDQQYCPHNRCNHQGDSKVQIKSVKFINIKGSSSCLVGVNVVCSKSMPCQDIEFSGLDITMHGSGQPTTASCSNVKGNFLSNVVPTSCS
ncbi:Pectin lyase-like superfamily protein [Abeliophyllum distichum]|uniref:Pectin lyase-like superfamily protein n=1 Tax=Abeliophyllum distichum TaxID=126358 RepID=A0ABD1PNL9_9LAMI